MNGLSDTKSNLQDWPDGDAPLRGRARGGGESGGGAHRRCRRFRGPSGSVAGTRAASQDRPQADLHPGACRAVSGLHREGAEAATRSCSRLPGHGGMAGLSQVAHAHSCARGQQRGRARGSGRAAGLPAAAPAGYAGCRRPAHGAQSAGPRCLRARARPSRWCSRPGASTATT